MPEVASTEDPTDPSRKGQWIRALADLMADPDTSQRVEFVAWFSVHDRSWPDCQWEYDSSPASTAAMAEAIARFAASG